MRNAVVTPETHRVDMLLDEIVLENVQFASILSLLRSSERHINAQRLNCRLVLYGHRAQTFVRTSSERQGAAITRVRVSEGYIREKLNEIIQLEREIACDRNSKLRLQTANRSGGQHARSLRHRNQAIVVDLGRSGAPIARERDGKKEFMVHLMYNIV